MPGLSRSNLVEPVMAENDELARMLRALRAGVEPLNSLLLHGEVGRISAGGDAGRQVVARSPVVKALTRGDSG